MCSKAQEIQENWKAKAFDIYQDKAGCIRVIAEDYGCDFKSEGIDKYEWEKDVIWIFRQDQLQAMITHLSDEDLSIFDLAEHHKIDAFHRFVFPDDDACVMPHKAAVELAARKEAYVSKFKTQEQLWLAFVMIEKYKKIFNDDEWVKNEI
jgi:hypothetical protein